MKVNPLVSIIIPTYNRAKLVKDTLNSIIVQTYNNWECIIVDDGSTDNTLEVLEGYKQKDNRFQYYKRPNKKTKGANACRNYGLDVSKGDYIIFFDSDDIFSKTAVEERIDYFKTNTVDMIVTSMGLFSQINNLKIDKNRSFFNGSLEDTIEEFIIGDKLPWNGQRVTFKRELIKNKIYFNENMLRFQDVDFNIRVLKKLSPSYISIDTTDCYYRNDEISSARYQDRKFIDTLFENLYILYATIFKVIDGQQKQKLKIGLVLNFFGFIKAYYRKQNKSQLIIKIIKLFKKELKINYFELFSLYSISFFNKYYFKKKGYFKITKKIRDLIYE